jgi:hypothetical protein
VGSVWFLCARVCRRESFVSLLGACHEQSDESFWANVHESRWLHHVSTILKGRLQKLLLHRVVETLRGGLWLSSDSFCDIHVVCPGAVAVARYLESGDPVLVHW